MATNRSAVAALYTPIYDMFMLEDYKLDSQVWSKIYKEVNDSTKDWKYNDISALGMWQEVDEGSGQGYQDPVLGYDKTLTQVKKIGKVQISFEAHDQDEYALLKKEAEVRAMGRGAHAKTEYDHAQILINGFSTAGADGQYLWSNSHPQNRNQTGTTYDNLLSGAFSHDNLELAETQISNNFFDSKGIPIAYSDNPILLHPPALRGDVFRVLSDRALERPDLTVRDVNRFAGRYRPVEWTWLSSKNGGSDTAWYIIYPELGFLVSVWNSKPHFTSWIDEDNEYYIFKGRYLNIQGATNWRCGFASTGV